MKKKTLRLIALMLICVTLLCTLPSCSKSMALLSMPEETRANQFFILVNMMTVNSYKVELSQELSGSVYGVNFTGNMTGFSEYSGYGTKNLVEYTEISMKTETGYDSSQTTTDIKAISGFYDGKMYYSYESGTTVSKLWSELSTDEYNEYQDELSDIEDDAVFVAIQESTGKSCTRLEDKSWVATYTGFTEEGMEAILVNFDPTVTMLDGYKPVDALVEVTADKDINLTSMTYTLYFDQTDTDEVYPEAKAKTSMKFSGFGTTEATKPDLSDFTEVEDLRVMQLAKNALDDFLDADKGQFTSNISQTFKIGQESQTVTEKDNGSFERKDGKYTFSVSAKSDALDIKMDYADGTLTVKYGTESQQTDGLTDSYAEMLVTQSVDSAGFLSANFSNIEVIDEAAGKYKFTVLDPSLAALDAYFEAYEAEYIRATAEITVVLGDEEIKEYEYRLVATASSPAGSMRFEVTQKTAFSTPLANEEM